MQITLKEAAKNRVVGFAGRSLPLRLRPDLDKLAIIAHESQDKSLLDLFEKLPSLAQLKGAKIALELPVLPDIKPASTHGTAKENRGSKTTSGKQKN